jgi:hypothetical protein
MIMQANGYVMPYEQIGLLLPAIEQTLWDLQPIPNNPGNLTAYAGTYLAAVLGGCGSTPFPLRSAPRQSIEGISRVNDQVHDRQRHREARSAQQLASPLL